MELIFSIDIQKKSSISYAWDKEKNFYIQKEGKFKTYTRNCQQKATIGMVKSSLKIPLQHNGIVPKKSVDQSIRNRWHISSQMTTQQRAETPTST